MDHRRVSMTDRRSFRGSKSQCFSSSCRVWWWILLPGLQVVLAEPRLTHGSWSLGSSVLEIAVSASGWMYHAERFDHLCTVKRFRSFFLLFLYGQNFVASLLTSKLLLTISLHVLVQSSVNRHCTFLLLIYLFKYTLAEKFCLCVFYSRCCTAPAGWTRSLHVKWFTNSALLHSVLIKSVF